LAEGLCSAAQAERLAAKLMHENAERLLGLLDGSTPS
jgi:hypothetical protein